jgi:hypothetical protein
VFVETGVAAKMPRHFDASQGSMTRMSDEGTSQTASRFLAGLRRIDVGLAQQRARILQRNADAPRLHRGSPYDVVDLRADPANDLDYYVYELGRLQDLAKEIINRFSESGEIAVH